MNGIDYFVLGVMGDLWLTLPSALFNCVISSSNLTMTNSKIRTVNDSFGLSFNEKILTCNFFCWV